jgi:hypothetical protein
MWGQQPVRAVRTAPARRLRYAHFAFPGQVPVTGAIDRIDRALADLGGWSAAGTGETDQLSGHRVWTHRDAAVELQAVVVGLQPLTVSVGQRSRDPHVRLDTRAIRRSLATARALDRQLATVRRALSAIERGVRFSGGWPVRDVDLPGYVEQARRRLEWWVWAEHRVEWLTRYLSHRRCSVCQGWSRHDARWCRCCRYEFGPRDDMDRDDARAGAEREVAALNARGVAMRGGQSTDADSRSVQPSDA